MRKELKKSKSGPRAHLKITFFKAENSHATTLHSNDGDDDECSEDSNFEMDSY